MDKQTENQILQSIATLLSNNNLDTESASKLLNTFARFDERVHDMKD